ncbi:MAG: [Fe-S]-binding protein [Candidatus Yanofskybacteria bacterium RIFCSPHIGHO2_01_FULL_44_17]|uniref:[Fe-S]-binding protein n=1 Tax=Candidatus Yanofskybacteria bacterium RIFCSPHIGHO2_01_FULL_44_17 TaxID=1802668 RepID=A0A1F8EXV5_9BACT|nr:MAG: [Fe-S]-binding protein [Candidatus Yanofskybacteria bacterium RIFCSPHIGHO2_01_FULL_44_17]
MITMTPTAINKAISAISNSAAEGLRISVEGGGCSGFQYKMSLLEPGERPTLLDKIHEFEGQAPHGSSAKIKVFIDQASLLYLDGCEIDYVESLEASGFKFNNPNVKSTCGCGASFQP